MGRQGEIMLRVEICSTPREKVKGENQKTELVLQYN